MNTVMRLVWRYRRLRGRLRRFINVARRNRRIIFPSPAEVDFVRLLGGRVILVPWFRDPRTHYPAAVFVSLGRLLRHEYITREVPCGRYWIDFGNDIKRGIEIDGREYHRDIVREQERTDYLSGRGWILLRIPASRIYREPNRVQQDVMRFLQF